MINSSVISPLRKASIAAGLGLLFMAFFAIIAVPVIFEQLIVPGDAGATVDNILAEETTFRIGIASLCVVAILDVVVAWALYIFFEPASKHFSLLASWFRVVYASILGVALFDYANVLRLVSGARGMNGVELDRLRADVMRSLQGFDDGWAVGLIFFGIHLGILGYLVLRSDYVPRMLGIVLLLAGAAYVADSFSRFLFPRNDIELAVFVGWGEMVFMAWLLYYGFKTPKTSLGSTGS